MKKANLDAIRLKETAGQLAITEGVLQFTRKELTVTAERLSLTTQRLQNVEASAQQMSQENEGLRKTAIKFANDKERDAETISKLVKHLDGAIESNKRMSGAFQAETVSPR